MIIGAMSDTEFFKNLNESRSIFTLWEKLKVSGMRSKLINI